MKSDLSPSATGPCLSVQQITALRQALDDFFPPEGHGNHSTWCKEMLCALCDQAERGVSETATPYAYEYVDKEGVETFTFQPPDRLKDAHEYKCTPLYKAPVSATRSTMLCDGGMAEPEQTGPAVFTPAKDLPKRADDKNDDTSFLRDVGSKPFDAWTPAEIQRLYFVAVGVDVRRSAILPRNLLHDIACRLECDDRYGDEKLIAGKVRDFLRGEYVHGGSNA